MNPNLKRNAAIAGVVAAVVIGGGALFLSTNPTPPEESPWTQTPAAASPTPISQDAATPVKPDITTDASALSDATATAHPMEPTCISATPADLNVGCLTAMPESASTPTVSATPPDCDAFLFDQRSAVNADIQAWCECAAPGQCQVQAEIEITPTPDAEIEITPAPAVWMLTARLEQGMTQTQAYATDFGDTALVHEGFTFNLKDGPQNCYEWTLDAWVKHAVALEAIEVNGIRIDSPSETFDYQLSGEDYDYAEKNTEYVTARNGFVLSGVGVRFRLTQGEAEQLDLHITGRYCAGA